MGLSRIAPAAIATAIFLVGEIPAHGLAYQPELGLWNCSVIQRDLGVGLENGERFPGLMLPVVPIGLVGSASQKQKVSGVSRSAMCGIEEGGVSINMESPLRRLSLEE